MQHRTASLVVGLSRRKRAFAGLGFLWLVCAGCGGDDEAGRTDGMNEGIREEFLPSIHAVREETAAGLRQAIYQPPRDTPIEACGG